MKITQKQIWFDLMYKLLWWLASKYSKLFGKQKRENNAKGGLLEQSLNFCRWSLHINFCLSIVLAMIFLLFMCLFYTFVACLRDRSTQWCHKYCSFYQSKHFGFHYNLTNFKSNYHIMWPFNVSFFDRAAMHKLEQRISFRQKNFRLPMINTAYLSHWIHNPISSQWYISR